MGPGMGPGKGQFGVFFGRRQFGVGWAWAEEWTHGRPVGISGLGAKDDTVAGRVSIYNVPCTGGLRVGWWWMDL